MDDARTAASFLEPARVDLVDGFAVGQRVLAEHAERQPRHKDAPLIRKPVGDGEEPALHRVHGPAPRRRIAQAHGAGGVLGRHRQQQRAWVP